MLTTRRRFGLGELLFRRLVPELDLLCQLDLLIRESSGTFPISFKYIRTGSSTPTPLRYGEVDMLHIDLILRVRIFILCEQIRIHIVIVRHF